MKNIFITLTFLFCTLSSGQSLETQKNGDLYKSAPNWAKLMYSTNPNVNEVEKLYENYYNSNRFTKSYHTQYYKRWRKAINPYINNEGFIDSNKKIDFIEILNNIKTTNENKNINSGTWIPLGPFRNLAIGGILPDGGQANVFTIGRCEAQPNVMYCGTEPGEVYKSIDGANSWVCVSKTLVTSYTPYVITANAGIMALAVHPTNPEIVYIGSGTQVFKTINSGIDWFPVFDSQIQLTGYFENPAEIHINSSNPEIVIVGGKEGMYRTENGGITWQNIFSNECFDIKNKPGNPNTLYSVRVNNSNNTHEFIKSIDAGITWIPQILGWYTSSDPSRSVSGARIAVSEADSNRVYAFLIGDSKSGDNGFIGIYRSNDAGVSWTNTMGYDGAPYFENTHPNLISSSPVTDNFTMNQGFYNCAIMASNTNADELLVGGIGMWRSNNGGQSFQCKYNYRCGDFNPMHVDMQDFRAFGNDYWATTDGGIYKSNNLFDTQPEFKMNGVRAVDFLGFGSGWNRDILIGGAFHNGVDVYAEGFPFGDFLNLTRGEPASGYVNPNNQSRVYSTNLGSRIIPQTITGEVLSAPFEERINESGWFGESSELEFHPSCHNHIYKGYQNKLYKSVDGGASFTAIYSAIPDSKVLGIEISRTNTNTMYIVVRPNSGNGYLVKTTDDWLSSSIIEFPYLGNNLGIISLDPENDLIIWLAYPRGNNGNKVFKSINGGITWNNETTAELNGQDIQAMTTIGGTNGGIYLATNITCYYKSSNFQNWIIDNNNLPTTIGTIGIRPFYRDGKIRIASLGKGIWESPLFETPNRPVAKIMVDKLRSDLLCDNVFSFDDYSMLNHTNATWFWTFHDANISTSSARNPQVIFNSLGNHLVTLTVTDANGNSSNDSIVITIFHDIEENLNQNFENQLLLNGWFQESTGNLSWSYNNVVGGFGLSTNCMFINNYISNARGVFTDIVAPVDMSNTNPINAVLNFDVAYSYYGPNYADKLQVLISTDCGENYSIVYEKEGQILATAPSTQIEFVPTSTQWRRETIDLSSYVGNENVYIKFRNINQYGQRLYIDNINFGEINLNSVDFKIDSPLVFPNPLSSQGFITVKGTSDAEIKFNLINIEGKLIDTIFTRFNTPFSIEKYNLSQGTYLYKIISENKILNGKLIISDRN